MNFLKRFADVLTFNDDDLENSMLAIEGFVLEHWAELNYLQDKKDYKDVSEQYIRRLSRVTERNKGRLFKEVRESEQLMRLLTEARTRELNDEEKGHLQGLLIEALKAVPTFVIISLPQHFLTLPILMQILPKNFIVDSLSPN